MNTEFENLLNKVRQVVELEGWDIALLQKHLEIYLTANDAIQEGLRLKYQFIAEQCKAYMRIRDKRTQAFWDNCKATNQNIFREWVDLRRLSKDIRSRIYPKPKRIKKSAKEEAIIQQDTGQTDSCSDNI